jgi:hypothetical protein
MADYTPVYMYGRALTLTLSVACVGGDLLEVSGNGTVRPWVPNATPSNKIVGVASEDTAVNGRVTVWGFGPVHESIADGTVTAGDQIMAAANAGKQVMTVPAVTTPTPGDVTTTRAILGVALTTAATGLKVRWMQCFGG